MAIDTTAPPKVNRPPTQAQKRQSGKLQERTVAVQGLFQLAGFGCIVAGWHADAGAIGEHSPAISQELAALADKNASVAKFIDSLTEAGPYAGLIVAVMPLTLQILANHGILKGDMSAVGVKPPAILEAEVKTSLALKQAEVLRAQNDAETQLAQMRAEKADSNGQPENAEARV